MSIILLNKGLVTYVTDKRNTSRKMKKLIILPHRYEGAAFAKPSTNNGLESLNAVIKQKYTLRNKLHLSTFLPKVEVMLSDWSQASLTTPFATVTDITFEMELHAYKWSINVNQHDIIYFIDNFYIVPVFKMHYINVNVVPSL